MKAFKLGALVMSIMLASSSIAYSADLQSVKNDPIVPVRFIADGIGTQVSWDESSGMVTVSKGENSLKLKAGSSEIISNEESKTLNSPIEEKEGRVFVPLSILDSINGSDLTEDDCMKILAVKYVDLLKAGNITDLSILCSESLNKSVMPGFIQTILASYKNYQNLEVTGTAISKNSVHKNVKLSCSTSNMGPLNITIRFDSNLKVDEQFTIPVGSSGNYTAPAYDNSKNYDEKEVVVGEGDWKLPATLTIPKGEGPFPVLVLVHGSGANDEDESVGAVKPFRDIAVGLAAKNIAVLRYTKRTNEYNVKSSLIPKMTVYDETIDDAVSAIKSVGQYDKIDSKNIFVLGHSQGGLLMPRIVKADKDNILKGAVIMSGTTRPLPEVFMSQLEYLKKLGGSTQQYNDFYKAQFDLLNKPDFNPDNPPAGYQLGTPYWWKDLASYNPANDAADITKPMLIMQGGRDYQVTAAEDFKGWKDALGKKSNVTFKLFPKLNHIYTEGEGEISTPQEYFKQANIPEYVIDALADWITSQK